MRVTIDCDDQQEVDQVQQAMQGDGQVMVRRAFGPVLIADSVEITALGSPVVPDEG